MVLLLPTFVLGSFLVVKYKIKTQAIAVVKQEQTPVYVGANEQFGIKAQLAQGQEINILQKKGEWYKIEHLAIVGWIPAQSVYVV